MDDIRLFISESDREKILTEIDKNNFMNLGKENRIDLYVFALALALNTPTELEKQDALVKSEHIKKYDIFLYSAYLNPLDLEKNPELIEEIMDKKTVFGYCDKCVNTGLAMLKSKMLSDQKQYALELIKEMDEMYNTYLQ